MSKINMTTVVHICRKHGQIVQDCDVYIGRACNRGGWDLPQSKWHNPFTVNQYGDQAIVLYEQYIRAVPFIDEIEELRGKRLGCWCRPNPCHGDILVKILNERQSQWTAGAVVKPLKLNIQR
jgi:hypothetical protein